MNYKHLLLLAALGCSVSSFAQGIHFETGNWKTVVAKAQKEKKLIYVDVFTTWCGPCKMLASTIFPQKEAGDKYNALFVNYSFDAEKGEGVELAKKYNVDGYPTQLFINPENQAVVFREMGASDDVGEFNKHADIAQQESKDPMTWEQMTNQFTKGQKDTVFLIQYLTKAHRLNKNNDAIIDAYIGQINKERISPAQLDFLAGNIQTFDNNAVAIFYKHSKDLDKRHTEWPGFTAEHLKMWDYATFEKAVANANIKLLDVLAKAKQIYTPEQDAREMLWYREQYFKKTNDEENWKEAAGQLGNFLTNITMEKYAADDQRTESDAISKLRSELIMMHVPDSALDAKVQLNLKKNPSRLHHSATMAALNLNDMAWYVYLQYPKEKDLVTKALVWAKTATDLLNTSPDMQPSIADTYAHLLFISGDKEKALATEKQAVATAQSRKGNEIEANELQANLLKMQNGNL